MIKISPSYLNESVDECSAVLWERTVARTVQRPAVDGLAEQWEGELNAPGDADGSAEARRNAQNKERFLVQTGIQTHVQRLAGRHAQHVKETQGGLVDGLDGELCTRR